MAKRKAYIGKEVELKQTFKVGDAWHTLRGFSHTSIDIEFESKQDFETKCDNLYKTVHAQAVRDLDQTIREFKDRHNI